MIEIVIASVLSALFGGIIAPVLIAAYNRRMKKQDEYDLINISVEGKKIDDQGIFREQLLKRHEQLINQISELSHRQDVVEQQLAEQMAKNSSLTEQNKALVRENTRLARLEVEQGAKIRDLESRIVGLEDDLKSANRQIAELSRAISQNTKDISEK